MHKLEHFSGGKWVCHSHPPLFERQQTGSYDRLVCGIPGGDPAVMLSLAQCMSQPFYLLYLLHTPREGAPAGRYQSPPLTNSELHAFFADFAPLLRSDARHDIWIFSPDDRATLVWDRHNLLYAYGPLDSFTQVLRGLGFHMGTPDIPTPHAHLYHAEMDGLVRVLLDRYEWIRSDLMPEDKQ
ncbi:MAG TPA: hypothetical protein VGD10_01910 [Allosphingosinicella sp.]|uniref:hypothetical protein n=1 Tax=Allosphingosinicella sp. TaxID=2823234 RepID=UPI002ED774AC